MAALEAAAQVKMQVAVEERSLKQSGGFRLVADPSHCNPRCPHRVLAVQAEEGSMEFDLPTPTGPMSYGWHTAPHGEWLPVCFLTW